MSESDRWDQKHAEEIVAVVTGGTVCSRDVGGAPPGTHDFDVVLPDGRVVAVEITRHTDSAQLQRGAEVRKRNWSFLTLACSWHLTLIPDAQVGALHDEVVALLSAVEEAGYDRVMLCGAQDVTVVTKGDVQRALGRLRDLGVCSLIRLPRVKPSEVICGPWETAGWTGGDLIAEAVEHHATRKACKLERASADERHLFLWIEFSQQATIAALGFTDLPQAAPDLPPSVDAVWLVEAFVPGRVLVYRRDRGWVDHGTWGDGGPGWSSG